MKDKKKGEITVDRLTGLRKDFVEEVAAELNLGGTAGI